MSAAGRCTPGDVGEIPLFLMAAGSDHAQTRDQIVLLEAVRVEAFEA